MNSAIVSGSSGNDGIGFAIPINMAASVANMLIKDGKVHYARIGIQLAPLTPALARQLGLDEGTKGVLVGECLPGSPAEKAGLKQGDVIIGFAGEKIQKSPVVPAQGRDQRGRQAVRDGLHPRRQGADHVDRAGPAEKVVFDLEKQGKSGMTAAEGRRTREDGDQRLRPRSSAVDRRAGQAARTAGGTSRDCLSASVKDGSPAEAAGIEEGDVITKVIRDHKPQPLTSVKEFQDIAAKTDELAIYVQNGKVGGRSSSCRRTAK